MRTLVLAYHSQNISGNTYGTNDHVALYHDLRTIHARGFHIIPLLWIAEWVIGQRGKLAFKSLAITFDDGSDFDYYDLDHPYHGFQRSFYNILRDFQSEFGCAAQPHLHASSFVIASPTARRDICARSMAGLNWMNDNWWNEANNSGIMSIYNHSWDHNLSEVSVVCEDCQRKGSFDVIDTYGECQCEVQQAAEYIHRKIYPAWPTLFAYPYGQSSEYIRDTYFPNFQEQHRTLAAFGTGGGYITKASPRWNLPRFVCGSEWRETGELIQILDEI